MKYTNNRSGFTLLELLTVIAIIAILAGVLFPVFKTVKDNAKRAHCITNLHDIGVGLQQYKLDNRQYPDALLARYEVSGAGGTTPPMPATMAEASGGLYPEYVRSIKAFRCPSASSASGDTATGAMDVPAGIGVGTTKSVKYFEGDSYDWTDVTGSGNYIPTYLKVWAFEEPFVSSLAVSDGPDTPEKVKRDYARQLAWRSPDATTVVTWCMNHRGGGERALVLFLDASVDTIPMSKMTPAAGGGENNLWRVLPQ